jgi:hypothetical protein
MSAGPVFIRATSTEHTGGNCMADLIELRNGKALCLTDECVCLFDNPNDFLNEDGKGVIENARYMDGADSLARADNATELSAMGLTFVEAITTYEPDGPVSVDLIVLCDGRVLGVDSESIVLYPSMEAFDALDGSEEFPSLTLTGVA